MNLRNIARRLTDEAKPVTFRVTGNSMTPKIKSGDRITVIPHKTTDPVRKGDIVLAHVAGRFYVHLVSAVEDDRVQISNNHGHVNGWTNRNQIYGKVER